jgi:hypothetical protein
MRDRSAPPIPVLLLALLVPLAAMIPTWQGFLFEDLPNRIFMGFRYMPRDHYTYAAFMRQAQDGGGLLMRNPFTSEPQLGVFVLPMFWAVGTLARLIGGSIVLWWEVFRLIGGALYVLAFWWFSGLYFRTPQHRTLATALFCLGGGLDWIILALRAAGIPGLDKLLYPSQFHWNWSTLGSMQMPNWIWAAMLLTVAARAACRSSRWRDLALLGLMPLLWLVHPYSAMVGYLAFALLPMTPLVSAAAGLAPMPWARFRSNLRIALPALLSFLFLVPYLLWARSDLVFRLSSERGATWTETFSPWWYVQAYGLVLPLSWFGLRALIKESSLHADLLLSWLAAAIILSINPLYAGVKFQFLVFPPLALLATRGLLELHAGLPLARKLASSRAAVMSFAGMLCLNSLFIPIKDFSATPDDTNIFMTSEELTTMRWLGRQPDGIVLSTKRAGNRIPWLAGKVVFVGHWFLTLDHDAKLMKAKMFFSSQVPLPTRLAILQESRARYVYVSPDEAPEGFDPSGLPLTKIYEAGQHAIYEVRTPDRASDQLAR